MTIGDGLRDSEGRLEFYENLNTSMSSLTIIGAGDVNRLYRFS